MMQRRLRAAETRAGMYQRLALRPLQSRHPLALLPTPSFSLTPRSSPHRRWPRRQRTSTRRWRPPQNAPAYSPGTTSSQTGPWRTCSPADDLLALPVPSSLTNLSQKIIMTRNIGCLNSTPTLRTRSSRPSTPSSLSCLETC